MKLFGGKKGDERQPGTGVDDEAGYYDSPQETVSLSDTPRANVKAAAAAATAVAREAAPVEDEPRPHYGIEQAIQLMRALPVDQNPELVVQVIKTTLESLRVKVSDIIGDAVRKQKDLEERVQNLKRAIADFEKEIETRREEISRLEADNAETSAVRARLEMAEKLQQKSNPTAKATSPSPVVAKSV